MSHPTDPPVTDPGPPARGRPANDPSAQPACRTMRCFLGKSSDVLLIKVMYARTAEAVTRAWSGRRRVTPSGGRTARLDCADSPQDLGD
jgi:hypothetical protein